jgi:4-amino-4-deoxy-L-arabinose transferase-like glycosyltransferase
LFNRLGLLLAFLGVVLAGVAVVAFASLLATGPLVNDTAWWLYAASVLAWIMGMLLVTRGREPGEPHFPWLLIPIVVLAIGLRVSELESYPFGIWFDEAMSAIQTRRIMTDSNFRPVVQSNITFLNYLLYAGGSWAYGDGNIAGLRIVSALQGVGAVIAAYYVGRLLRGEAFGLIFAFILAVMRWSINFSRIGMTGIDVVLFVLLTLWALIRLGRSGHLRDALLLGAAIGIGLWFYRAFQLLLLPLAVYALMTWRWRLGWKRTAVTAFVGVLTILVLVYPLGAVAVYQPDRLFGRVEQTNIFNLDLRGRPVTEVLIESAQRHIGMFTHLGDRNGRHNLPDAPMLDPITGVLFVGGMLVAIWQIRKREHIFFFLLLAAGLAGGILTLPSEAPQALRAIGVLPAVGYFAALAADVLRKTALWAAQRLRPDGRSVREVGVVAAFALGAPMLVFNYHVYFNLQRHNYDVWISYSTIETVAARWLEALPPEVRVWASPNIDYGLPTQYLAPTKLTQVSRLDIPAALPIRTTVDVPVALLFARDQDMYLAEARRLYPDARVTPILASDFGVNVRPNDADALFYSVLLTPQEIAAVQGLEGGIGLLYAPIYGEYRFFAPSGSTVTINGTPYTTEEFAVRLWQGNHTIHIEPQEIVLQWRMPGLPSAEFVPPWAFYRASVGISGLVASYYPNADWEGEPTLVRLEPFVYRYIHVVPLPRPYSALWQGSLYAPMSGSYTLGLRAMTEGTLRVNGQLLVESNSVAGGSAQITLTEGWHSIEVRQRDTANFSRMYLEWIMPGAAGMQAVTSEYLRPN